MTDLRENLGWLVGSILTGIAVAVSWLVSSGIFTTLVAVLVGAGITYFVQTRTQKKTQERAWKRESDLRTIEKVYGPLFEDVDKFLRYLREEIYPYISTQKWEEIQSTYHYMMLDKPFQRKINEFYEKVDIYNKTLLKIKREIIPTIQMEEAEKFLGFQPKTLKLFVRGKRFIDWTTIEINIPLTLLKKKQPIEMVSVLYPEMKKPSFHLEITNPAGNPYSYTHPEWMKEFDKFWKRCHKRLEADSTVQSLREQYAKLISETEKLRKELVTRIEQPLKI